MMRKAVKVVRYVISRLLRDLSVLDFFVITFECFGIKLRLTRSALSLALWVDKHERIEDVDFLNKCLRPGDVFIDVGAHIGHLSILAGKLVGDKGRVFSFEPHPRTYKDLIFNLSLNRSDNVFPACLALSNKNSWVSFTDEVRANDQNRISEKGVLKVLSLRLDSLLDVMILKDVFVVLKIDTEGFEKYVLEGAVSVLEHVDLIYFECIEALFERNGYSSRDVYDFLRDMGFEFGYFSNGNFFACPEVGSVVDCSNMVAFKRDEISDRLVFA